jgi:hypothetical protein
MFGLDDLYSYDIVSMTWTRLFAAADGTHPASRSSHGFTSMGNKLYVYGGRGPFGNECKGRGRGLQ